MVNARHFFAQYYFARAVRAAALFIFFLSAPAASAAKTFIYCAGDPPSGYDIALYSDQAAGDAVGNMVYQRLVAFAPGSAEIIPRLAEKWEISADGKIYTFHLRKGVKFQAIAGFTPTRDFNADDVLFSLRRQADKTHPYYAYERGQSYQYYDDMDMIHIIKQVRKTDDYTVQIELYQAEAPFLADMTMDFASILSKEYADKLAAEGNKAELNRWPVGTGPFILAAKQKNEALRYKANPDYWRGKQPLDNLIFAFVPDSLVRSQKVKKGECDLIFAPPLLERPGLLADKNVKFVEKAGMNVSYLAWNTTKAPFDRANVRRALNMAINREFIYKKLYQGAVDLANNPLPPVLMGYDKDTPQAEYSPEKAKALLEKEGIKNLEFNIYLTDKGGLIGNPKLLGEVLQADWKKIGVKANIVQMEWVELLKLMRDKNREGVVYSAWNGDNGDPDNFLGILFNCGSMSNNSFFCNKSYDEITRLGRQTADTAKRAEYYKQAQALLYREQPLLLMGYFKDTAVLRQNISGFKLLPHGLSFEGVDKN